MEGERAARGSRGPRLVPLVSALTPPPGPVRLRLRRHEAMFVRLSAPSTPKFVAYDVARKHDLTLAERSTACTLFKAPAYD
jgi:hypothetical protein